MINHPVMRLKMAKIEEWNRPVLKVRLLHLNDLHGGVGRSKTATRRNGEKMIGMKTRTINHQETNDDMKYHEATGGVGAEIESSHVKNVAAKGLLKETCRQVIAIIASERIPTP